MHFITRELSVIPQAEPTDNLVMHEFEQIIPTICAEKK